MHSAIEVGTDSEQDESLGLKMVKESGKREVAMHSYETETDSPDMEASLEKILGS